jgi:hypothetical protein
MGSEIWEMMFTENKDMKNTKTSVKGLLGEEII